MSDAVLSKSKFLCYLQIQQPQKQSIDPLLRPDALVLSIYHHHYPVIYHPTIFQHFKAYFAAHVTPNHVQLVVGDKQIPWGLPMGLFVANNGTVLVRVRQQAVADGFRHMMISWKKGYTIVNKQAGCDHVFKKLNESQQRQLYNLHEKGASHGLNRIPKYEGNGIAIKIFYEGMMMQRKQQDLALSIRQYILRLFNDEQFLKGKTILVHGIQINVELSLKQLLEEWNYNDGFCYLHIKD